MAARRKGRNSTRASSSSSSSKIKVNRAPLLLLWVAIVAQREGYKFTEGLSFAKAVTIICGHSKGKAIGLYKDKKKKGKTWSSKKEGLKRYQVFGMKIPGKVIKGHRYAVKSGHVLTPSSSQAYIKKAFGNNLSKVKYTLRRLASKYPRKVIGRRGYFLYELFRPSVSGGLKGWGARGILDLNKVQRLTKEATRVPIRSKT